MMNKIKLLVTLLGLILNCPIAIADASEHWKCFAEDHDNNSWSFEGRFKIMVSNEALDLCKKISKIPNTCTTRHCELVTVSNTAPLWRCTALDANADTWRSTSPTNQYDAVLNAKAYCRRHSPIPGSCYSYMIMCKNVTKEP